MTGKIRLNSQSGFSIPCGFLVVLLAVLLAAVESRAIEARSDLREEDWGGVDRTQPAVLLFHSVNCPISDRYAPVISRLVEKYQESTAIRFYLVFPNLSETDSEIAAYLESRKWALPIIRDRSGRLTRFAGAQVTPEVVVLLPGESRPQIIYRGRYDDRYTELGKSRPRVGVSFVNEVLMAVAAGKRPEFRDTNAVGCYINGGVLKPEASARDSGPSSAREGEGHAH